jgi:precorrin-6Y C5,15-methyltransferase (decarboxylating)
MTPWLTVLGIGNDGLAGLSASTRALVDQAAIVFGPERVLAGAELPNAEIHDWQAPLANMIEQIKGWRGRRVVVLATGDPMHFGIGATMTRHLPLEEMAVIPAPSAFSLAAARLGWPLAEVECLSLHGRAPDRLTAFLQPGARLIALTSGAQTVQDAAAILVQRGYGASPLTVLEHMGGPAERIVRTTARDCAKECFAEFNTLAIECVAGPGAALQPLVPGLPDDAFEHDGQLTKREVRAATLSALAPTPGALLWDIGAGCGSVAIEWLRTAKATRAIAFERDKERLDLIARNAAALGAPDLEIVAGAVPGTLDGAPRPDAVFLGGAVVDEEVFTTAWNALPSGGRFVANTVTLEGEAALIARQSRLAGELVRIDIAHMAPVGAKRALRPRMAVLQWRVRKA